MIPIIIQNYDGNSITSIHDNFYHSVVNSITFTHSTPPGAPNNPFEELPQQTGK